MDTPPAAHCKWRRNTYNEGMTTEFSVSPSAEARISELLADEPQGSFLRISVHGGGCSGFQYAFDFDTAFDAAEDLRVESAVPVVIDGVSLDLLRGSMLDYVETLGAAMFEIRNPNATASCGCGNSFAV